MRLLTRLLALAGVTAALGAPTPAGAACDVPLAIGQAGAQANVLILLDNSMSMNEALVSADYNPNIKYTGSFNATQAYNITTSGTYTPKNFGQPPNAPSAYLVASDGGRAGVYYGNYLNWVFNTATATQRAAIPVVTRMQAAKAVVSNVLATVTGCQFAVEVFNGGTGGTIIANFGSTVAAMQTQVAGIVGDSFTPLAEALVTASDYFSSTGVNAPFQASCQKSFVVIVTDGMPTQDTTVPNYITDSDHNGYFLDNVASYMYRNDLRPDLDGMQNVATFTIGFNVDATATALLQLTADNGGGSSFSINDAAGLDAALTQDFNAIAARVSAGAAVSVVSSENRNNNRLFRARYESQTWKGYLESFNLPYHSGDNALWEAGALLQARDPATRMIFTSTTGTNKVAFTTSNAASLLSSLAAVDVATATNNILYATGAAVAGTRDRAGWKLGDIVDAAPVTVGAPNIFNNLPDYSTFRTARWGRPEAVYAAANDGMLHCFDSATGNELWGYIPRNQLARLPDLMSPTYCHEYFLNMSPVAYDIYSGGVWRTVVIGGEAQGGSGLFALDVSTPSADTMSVMWDVDLPALKGSWNGPSLVRDRNRNAQVLCVGTGYDPTIAQTNLLVLDPADGSVLSTFALGSPVGGNKTTKATVIDRDFDGYDDLMYLGDLAGNIWRIDLTTNPWTVSRLFNCGQPIQGAPVVTLDELGRAMIFFGTGQYITVSDPANTATETIYGIVDNNSGGMIATSDLVDQTNSITGLTTGQRGWYLNLVQHAGERVIRTPALIAGTLYVPSFLPNAGACAAGGQSWLYTLDFKDGSAPDHANGTANNVTSGRVNSMGDGILADPSVDLVNEQIILQSSNAVLLTQSITSGLKRLLVRSWRQKWN